VALVNNNEKKQAAFRAGTKKARRLFGPGTLHQFQFPEYLDSHGGVKGYHACVRRSKAIS
jgi:hypothetical protein